MSKFDDARNELWVALMQKGGVPSHMATHYIDQMLKAYRLWLVPETKLDGETIIVECGQSWEVRVDFPRGTIGNQYVAHRLVYVFAADVSGAIQAVLKQYPQAVVTAVNHGRKDAMVIAPVGLVR